MNYYKLIDIKDNKPYTLFHGVNGSKRLEMGVWLKADKKPVIDGSGGTEYISGFHLLKTKKECLKYLENFNNIDCKGVARCKAKGLRAKQHSRSNVYLADKILITNFKNLQLS